MRRSVDICSVMVGRQGAEEVILYLYSVFECKGAEWLKGLTRLICFFYIKSVRRKKEDNTF